MVPCEMQPVSNLPVYIYPTEAAASLSSSFYDNIARYIYAYR